MTNMFKRSLVALAIAGASTGAMAADVTLTDTTYATNQFMETMDEILSKEVIITLNDEYKEGDFIMLQFEGEAYIDGLPNSITLSRVPGVTKGIGIEHILTTQHEGNTVAKYRVNNIYGDDQVSTEVTSGLQLNFGRLNFDASEVVALEGVEFTTFSRMDYDGWPDADGSTPDPLDVITDSGMTDTTTLFGMGEQFAIETPDDFEGILNVWNFRRSFVDPAANGEVLNAWAWTDDVAARVVLTQAPDNGPWDFRTLIDGTADTQILYRVQGENMFGWIEVDGNGAPVGNSVQLTTGCSYVEHDFDNLWVNCPNLSTPLGLTFDLGGTAESEQNPKQAGAYTVSAEVNWRNFENLYADMGGVLAPQDGVLVADPTGSTSIAAVEFGAWGVNGSMTTIPYMPYSAQSAEGEVTPISQIIYVTNTTRDPGTDDPIICNDPNGNDDCNGEGPAPENNDVNRLVWVEGIDEDGNTFGPVELPVTADPGVTSIAGEIKSVLFNAGLLSSSNKVALTVTVADYPTNIQVYSAYNVNGSDRGWVQNDTIRTDIDVYQGNEILD